MENLMIRKALTLFGVLALLLSFFAFGGSASAASNGRQATSSTPSVDIAAMQKTCQTLNVLMLHGKIQQAECHKQRSHGVTPNFFGRGRDCSGNWYGYTEEVLIYNYNWSQNLCFYGDNSTGYLGVNIYQVNEIVDEGGSSMWFLWYPGHHYRVLTGNGEIYDFGNGNTGVQITQLCYAGTVGGRC